VRFHPLLFPFLVFLMNGLLVWLIGSLMPGILISSLWAAISVSVLVSMTGMMVGGAFAADDVAGYERFVVQPLIKRYGIAKKISEPGVMFLEIDGLSQNVLQKALQGGYMPTVKRWLEGGSHRLTGWETDLSCQTGGCQPGILHGNNSNIPAFRWYEKGSGKLFSSDAPGNVAEVEKRVSNGLGLLANNSRTALACWQTTAPAGPICTREMHARAFSPSAPSVLRSEIQWSIFSSSPIPT